MSEGDLDNLLLQARQARRRQDWDRAAELYTAYLTQAPQDGQARSELHLAEHKRSATQEIAELKRQGDLLRSDGAYAAAEQQYALAYSRAVQERVFRDFVAIEQSQLLTRELLARELLARELLARAGQVDQLQAADRKGLIDQLNQQIAFLPDAPAYTPLRDELAQARAQIEQQLDEQERFDHARVAVSAADFDSALRLLATIPATSPLNDDVQYMRDYAQRVLQQQIAPVLRQVDQAIQEADWGVALDQLSTIRDIYASSPEVQRRRVETRLRAGQAELSVGQQAIEQYAFERARSAFERAIEHFETIVQQPASASLAQHLRQQAIDLAAVMVLAERAQPRPESEAAADWRGGALAALNNALARLERAEREGHSYPHVALALEERRNALMSEQGQVAVEQQQLQEGERLLRERQLDRAEQQFGALIHALSPAIARRASERLQEVIAARRRFEAALERGGGTGAPLAEAVMAYQEAYQIWPDGPEVVSKLEAALVAAGEQALLAENDENAALDYFEFALRLNSANGRAQEGWQRLTLSKRLGAELSQIELDLQQLSGSAESRTAEIAPLLDRLQQIQQAAPELPDIQSTVARLLDRAEQQQRSRGKSTNLLQKARRQQQAGNWAEAVRLLDQARQALKLPEQATADELNAELERWRQSLRATQDAERDLRQLLEQARSGYEQIQSADAVAAPLGALDAIEAIIERTVEVSYQAGGPLAPALRELRQEAANLRRVIEAAQRILALGTPQERLASTRDALAALGADPVLERLAQRFQDEQQLLVSDLQQRASVAHEQESIEEELNLIRQLGDAQPDETTMATRYTQLEVRQRFEERLRLAEQAAGGATSSETATRDTLRNALELFRERDNDIPVEVRRLVIGLTELADARDHTALADAAAWTRAQELLGRLNTIEHWTAERAAAIVRRWLRVAREAAVRGLIATMAELGDVLQAYELAVTYRGENPESEQALTYVQDAQTNLLATLKQVAGKHLSRSREMLDRGEPTIALEHINRLFQQFYTPIDDRLPGLLERLDEEGTLSNQRDEATMLRTRAEGLAQIAQEASQVLDKAQLAYTRSELADAAQLLQSLPDVSLIAGLTQRTSTLRAQIVAAQHQQAEQQCIRQLTNIQLDLSKVTTSDGFDAIQARLEQLTSAADWTLLTNAVREQCEQLWGRVQEQRTAFNNVQKWEQESKDALAKGDLASAQSALQSAIGATRDIEKQAQLRLQLDRVIERRNLQSTRDETLEQGIELLEEGKYTEARRAFAKVASLNTRLKPPKELEARLEALSNATRAGAQLGEAKRIWDSGRGLEGGPSALKLARQLLGSNQQFAALTQEIDFYLESFTQRLNQVDNHLSLARSALDAGDLGAAVVNAERALAIDSDHREAQKLVAEAKAQTLLRQAEQERTKGNDQKALDLVQKALAVIPNHLAAMLLQVEITSGLEASSALREAQDALYKGNFSEAQLKLKSASSKQANPAQLKEVQRLLDDLQTSYRAANIYPIRELIRNDQFQDALRRIREERKKQLSGELQAEIDDLQAMIERRWPDQTLAWGQAQLRSAQTEADFAAIEARLTLVLDSLSTFTQRAQIDHLRKQVVIGRLNYRLELIETALRYRLAPSDPTPARLDELPFATRQRLNEAPQTLEDAQQWARDLGVQARTQSPPIASLAQRANQLVEQIEDLIGDERLAKLRDERERLLAPARLLLAAEDDPRSLAQLRDELQRAHAKALQAAQIEELADAELATLTKQLEQEQRLVEDTSRALDRCVSAIRRHLFREANDALPPEDQTSRFLRGRAAQLRAIVEALLLADQLRHGEQWEEALTAYQQVLDRDRDLQLRQLLRADLDTCQRGYTEQLIAETGQALRGDRADLPALTARLDRAQQADWLTGGVGSSLTRLRSQIASRQQIEQASSLICQEQGDLNAALDLLDDARRRFSDLEWGQRIEQWEDLARARLAYQAREPDDADERLARLRPPIADLPIVSRTRELIEQQHAIRRIERLDQAITQATAALENDNLGQAEAALVPVAGMPSGRYAELDQIREQLTERRRVQAEVHRLIGAARELARREDWRAAVAELQRGRELAPAYARLSEALRDMQRRMAEAARRMADQQAFGPALDLCALGAQLGPAEPLAALRQEIEQQRAHAHTALLGQVQAALALWDSTRARGLIEQLAALGAGDVPAALQAEVAQMDQLSGPLQEAMQAGWRALERPPESSAPAALARYTTAAQCFAQARQLAPSFQEAERWHRFAEAMAQGGRLAGNTQNSADTYDQARAAFLTAVQSMRPMSAAAPPLLGSAEQVSERRSRARHNATALAKQVTDVLDLSYSLQQYQQLGNPTVERDMQEQIRRQRQALLDRYGAYEAPPVASTDGVLSGRPATSGTQPDQEPQTMRTHDTTPLSDEDDMRPAGDPAAP